MASLFHRFLYGFLAFVFYLLYSIKVDISWCRVVGRFVITFLIVVVAEVRDRLLQIPKEVERLQHEDILHRAMVSLNVTSKDKLQLQVTYLALNPVQLRDRIDANLEELWRQLR